MKGKMQPMAATSEMTAMIVDEEEGGQNVLSAYEASVKNVEIVN